MTGSNWSGESVVIPANKYPHCVQLVRSFGRRGIHTIVATDSMEWGRAPSLCSRYCDEAIHTPSPSVHLTEFKNSLLSLAERPDVRTITPIKEEDSYVLSKYRSEFSDHVDTLAPSFEILRQVQDRVLLVKAANEAGVPTPDTQILSEVEDWDRDVIIKTRYTVLTNEYVESVPSTVCRKVQPVKQIPAGTEPDVEAIQAEMGHDPVVQEFIRGAEFSVRAICDHGEPIATSIKRQLRGQSYGGGFSAYREPVELPKLEELTNSLLKNSIGMDRVLYNLLVTKIAVTIVSPKLILGSGGLSQWMFEQGLIIRTISGFSQVVSQSSSTRTTRRVSKRII